MKEVTEIPEKTDSKEEEIFNNFGKGICCAAQVFGALAPYCGIDPDQARKIALLLRIRHDLRRHMRLRYGSPHGHRMQIRQLQT